MRYFFLTTQGIEIVISTNTRTYFFTTRDIEIVIFTIIRSYYLEQHETISRRSNSIYTPGRQLCLHLPVIATDTACHVGL